MSSIHYLTEVDRFKVKKALRSIIQDMTEDELRAGLLYILHGIDIFEAIDSARRPKDYGP